MAIGGWCQARWDHPRIRGEHPIAAKPDNLVMGSSPHTRGARRPVGSRGLPDRIIPAYAGSTATKAKGRPFGRDHPRIRGEHTCRSSPFETPGGSSPHTRGALVDVVKPADRQRIIPAYAGSTRYVDMAAYRLEDHPRIRGEHVTTSLSGSCISGSSPHTRGARDDLFSDTLGAGIIPAYAGSTLSVHFFFFGSQDHPRIRGEHAWRETLCLALEGSSPHTRGAHVGDAAPLGGHGIIPAYAGSTAAG